MGSPHDKVLDLFIYWKHLQWTYQVYTKQALNPAEKGLMKTLWKARKCWLPSFSCFHNVLYPITDEPKHLSNIHLVICNCFQFGQVKILSFGKELNMAQFRNLSLKV